MNPVAREKKPAIEGWFRTGPAPCLIGTKCVECGTVAFPPTNRYCASPACGSREFSPVELSTRGVVWSYTDARYQPPAPYLPREAEYTPFALAAVKLEAEQMIVLAQVAEGFGVEDLKLGAEMTIVVETLYEIDGVEHQIYRWKPTKRDAR